MGPDQSWGILRRAKPGGPLKWRDTARTDTGPSTHAADIFGTPPFDPCGYGVEFSLRIARAREDWRPLRRQASAARGQGFPRWEGHGREWAQFPLDPQQENTN